MLCSNKHGMPPTCFGHSCDHSQGNTLQSLYYAGL